MIERLRVALDRMSVAAIASRTGFPPATVYHYLHGRTPSAEFCAACVKELGLNARWLMLGTGKPWIEQNHSGIASYLEPIADHITQLEDVQHRRLAILHRHAANMAAELAELRGIDQEIRRQLGTVIIPVLTQLRQRIQALIPTSFYATTVQLAQAARRLADFAMDPEWMVETRNLHAVALNVSGAVEEGLQLSYDIFQFVLARTITLDDAVLVYVYNLVHAQIFVGKDLPRARRFLLAWSHLARYGAVSQTTIAAVEHHRMLMLLRGEERITLASLRSGMRAYNELEPTLNQGNRGVRNVTLALSGTVAVRELIGADARWNSERDTSAWEYLCGGMLILSGFFESSLMATNAYACYRLPRFKQSDDISTAANLYALTLRDLLAGKGREAFDLYDRAPAILRRREVAPFSGHVARSQLARLAGDLELAIREAKAAQGMLDQRADISRESIAWKILHALTLLRLFEDCGRPSSLRHLFEAATNQHRAMLGLGYRMLRARALGTASAERSLAP